VGGLVVTDYFEEHARLLHCEEEASSLFGLAVASALTEYYATVTLIPDPPHTPRYDRAREAARRKYALVSVPAWEIRNRALNDLMACGEVSEATSFMFDELKVAQAMEEA
jgi:hypothetical protein